ncbi:MAG: glycosyltransferase [Bacteroidales bacterium]
MIVKSVLGFLVDGFLVPENMLIVILCIFFLIQCYYYCIVFLACSRYARRVRKGDVCFNTVQPAVSIIIYTKNNVDDLKCNLPEILKQKYPIFEIIIVNDGSVDDAKDYITRLKEKYNNLYHTYIPDEAHSLSRKKLAMTVGIKAAKYETVAFTDADCHPTSDMWIATMMRNFTTGIEVVIGNTSERSQKRENWYYSYYRLFFKLRFFCYALMHRPFMGEGTNLFFKKELFFACKGFSKHLAIQYGDDDIFTNEIMNKSNTRTEFSEEALVITNYENGNESIKETRLRRDFTKRFLKTSAHIFFSFERFSDFMFYAAFIMTALRGVYDNNLKITIIAGALFIIHYIMQAAVCHNASRTLNTPLNSSAILIYDIIRPFIDIYFRIIGHKSNIKNYTWKIRR